MDFVISDHSSSLRESAHMTSHPQPSTPNEEDLPPIGRACNLCRISHTACGPERPCHRCTKIGKAHLCSDVRMRKRGRPRKTDPRYKPRQRSSNPGNLKRLRTEADSAGQGATSAHHQENEPSLTGQHDGNGSPDEGSEEEGSSDGYGSEEQDSQGSHSRADIMINAREGADLASSVIDMMSRELHKEKQKNMKLQEKLQKYKEKNRQIKQRLAEVLDLERQPRMNASAVPQTSIAKVQLMPPIATSPALREARKILPFLSYYEIPPHKPFLFSDINSYPLNAVVMPGLAPEDVPVVIYANDAFAHMLQYSPRELCGAPLTGLWAQNLETMRTMAPFFFGHPPWSVSEIFKVTSLLRRRDGSTFRAMTCLQFFYDNNGVVKYALTKMLQWKNDSPRPDEQFCSWDGLSTFINDILQARGRLPNRNHDTSAFPHHSLPPSQPSFPTHHTTPSLLNNSFRHPPMAATNSATSSMPSSSSPPSSSPSSGAPQPILPFPTSGIDHLSLPTVDSLEEFLDLHLPDGTTINLPKELHSAMPGGSPSAYVNPPRQPTYWGTTI